MKKLDKCANVILVDEKTKLILGVSRKNDHEDFGLIGGKFEEGDMNPVFTAKREMKEETGIVRNIKELLLVHTEEYLGKMQYVYTATYNKDKLYTNEPHVMKWLKPIELTTGSFGDFNEKVFKLLGFL